MKKKLMKSYIYKGFGFPVTLHNVQMIKINNEDAPKIDIRALSDKVIKSFILQQEKLTGNQIKFIRTYFSMSLREFSKVINESHTAVQKWEKFKNKPTNMDPNIERGIRLYIYDKIFVKSQSDKSKFYNKYHAISDIISKQRYNRESNMMI